MPASANHAAAAAVPRQLTAGPGDGIGRIDGILPAAGRPAASDVHARSTTWHGSAMNSTSSTPAAASPRSTRATLFTRS
jgi:hypothetical protein